MRGMFIYDELSHTSHPFNIKDLTHYMQLLSIHLKWFHVHSFRVLEASFGVKSTTISNLPAAYCWRDFIWMDERYVHIWWLIAYLSNIQHKNLTCSLYVFVGYVCRQRLCNNFSVSRANFLTTLRSHLDVSCYFWSSLFNVDANYSF